MPKGHRSPILRRICLLALAIGLGKGNIPVDEYHSTAFSFNPQNYNPYEWASLAKRLGMQYAILTTKHHDGFAMFHTEQSDFSIKYSPYERDVVREFIDAMRFVGIPTSLIFLVSNARRSIHISIIKRKCPVKLTQLLQLT
jgi:alpha-L-fucosidase